MRNQLTLAIYKSWFVSSVSCKFYIGGVLSSISCSNLSRLIWRSSLIDRFFMAIDNNMIHTFDIETQLLPTRWTDSHIILNKNTILRDVLLISNDFIGDQEQIKQKLKCGGRKNLHCITINIKIYIGWVCFQSSHIS